jgi:aminocarboxymuconate-semialdehyde decarboxylase
VLCHNSAACDYRKTQKAITFTQPKEEKMSTRKESIQNVAGTTDGIAFTGCSVTNAAHAQPGGGRRRQVVVNGRRVKTIDVHAHCVIPEALALMGLTLEEQRGPGIGEVGARRIAEMDEQGIDVEALSINPTWYKAERDVASEVIRIQNEKLAGFCATYPDRFVAFA